MILYGNNFKYNRIRDQVCLKSDTHRKEAKVDVKNLNILPFTGDHIKQATAIERMSFPTPWTAEAFVGELTLKNSYGLAAVFRDDQTDRLVGYILGRWVLDEMEIINLAVHPGQRRKGIASKLLTEFIRMFEAKGTRRIFLEVRERNVAAIMLYKKFGFVQAGTRKGYYTDTGEDALIMRLDTDRQGPQGSDE